MPVTKKYKRYKRCVKKVKKQKNKIKRPHAVCRKAVYGKKKK